MSYDVIIVKTPISHGRLAFEVLNALLSLSVFEREYRLVFFNQGLSWLIEGQSPLVGKNLAKQLTLLPLYGVDNLYYCESHRQRLFPRQVFIDHSCGVELSDVSYWMRQASKVEVF